MKLGLLLLHLTSSLTAFSLILPWEFLQKIPWKNHSLLRVTRFLISNTFINTSKLKPAKNYANAKQHPPWDWTFAIWKSFILHPHYHPKIIGQTLKNKQKNIYACIQKNVRLIMMKMKMKMKNKSHKYVVNKLKS